MDRRVQNARLELTRLRFRYQDLLIEAHTIATQIIPTPACEFQHARYQSVLAQADEVHKKIEELKRELI